MTALAEVATKVFTVTQTLDVIWIDSGATASTAVVLLRYYYLSLGGRMNIEDDLWSRRSPFKVTSDTDPQFVDVCMFTIIRRNWQRVRDGQQLLRSIVLGDQPVEFGRCRKLHALKLPE